MGIVKLRLSLECHVIFYIENIYATDLMELEYFVPEMADLILEFWNGLILKPRFLTLNAPKNKFFFERIQI